MASRIVRGEATGFALRTTVVATVLGALLNSFGEARRLGTVVLTKDLVLGGKQQMSRAGMQPPKRQLQGAEDGGEEPGDAPVDALLGRPLVDLFKPSDTLDNSTVLVSVGDHFVNNPVIVVPGLHTALQAVFEQGFHSSHPCAGVPVGQPFTLYHAKPQVPIHPECLLTALTLQPPGPDGCVTDAPGVRIVPKETGFRATRGGLVHDVLSAEIYGPLVQWLEDMEASDIRIANYDWRKVGDACFEQFYFWTLKMLVELVSGETGSPVTFLCHSVGCSLLHAFLVAESMDWKHMYVRHMVAVAPTFLGTVTAMQNFIEGVESSNVQGIVPPMESASSATDKSSKTPFEDILGHEAMQTWRTLNELPPANHKSSNKPLEDAARVQMVGREAMLSWPTLYALLPVDTPGFRWESPLVSNQYRAFATADIDNHRFFDQLVDPPSRSAPAKMAELAAGFTERLMDSHLEWSMSDQGCVCRSACGSTLHPIGPDGDLHSVGFTDTRWCETDGDCGFEVPGGLRVDTCGNTDWPAEDAGPGFLFFKHLDMEPPATMAYRNQLEVRFVAGTSVEEMKKRCLNNQKCVGFDSQGLMRETSFRPTRRNRTIQDNVKGMPGHVGLWMKRRDVLMCTQHWVDTCDEFATHQVCGTDGITYKSPCRLQYMQCVHKNLEEAHDGPCRDQYLTPERCHCVGECDWAFLASYKWCYTEKGCGFGGGTWDYCNDHPNGVFKEGDGFDYYEGLYPPQEALEFGAEEGKSLAEIALACGMDHSCGGYTSEGWTFGRAAAEGPSQWRKITHGPGGIFRKSPELMACQQPCQEMSTDPVCLLANMKTFANTCLAKQALCYLSVKGVVATQAMVPGVCRRPGQFKLADMVDRWRSRAASATPPGVPVSCVYGTGMQTEVALEYVEFSGHVGSRKYVALGDGAVPSQTVTAVCLKWARMQLDPVRLIPQFPVAKLTESYFGFETDPTTMPHFTGHLALLSHNEVAQRVAEAAMQNWPQPAQLTSLHQFVDVNMEDMKQCQQDLEHRKLASLRQTGDAFGLALGDEELAKCVSAMLRTGILADLSPSTTEIGVQECSARTMSDWRTASPVCCMVKDTFGPGATTRFPCRMKMPTQHSARNMAAVTRAKGFHSVRALMQGLHERLMDSVKAGPLRPAKFSAGKSGSTFMLTADERFLLKNVRTDSQDEQRALHKLLEGYKGRTTLTEHLRQRTGSTFLNVILGMYSLEFAQYKATFILMEDAAMGMGRNRDPACRTRTYDLKGKSRKDVSVNLADETKKERENVEFKKFEKGSFQLSREDCQRLREGIAYDGEFLKEHHQIDYSIFARFGSPQCMMPDCEDVMQPGSRRNTCFTTTTGEKLAIAVIDYLNKYNFLKTVESALPGSWGKFNEYARKTSEFVNASCPI